MRPILFTFSLPFLGEIPLYAYPFFLALGFFCGSLLAGWLSRRLGGDFRLTVRFCLWCFIGGYLGARVWFFLVYHQQTESLTQYLSFWNGGLAVQGGVVGGALGGLLACRIWRMDWRHEFDCAAAGMALATVFTRIGCFCNGCCWGRLCSENFWAGVKVSNLLSPVNQFYLENMQALREDAVRVGLSSNSLQLPLAVHPTQLYTSAGGLLTMLVLVAYMLGQGYHRGAALGWFLVLDAASRFLIEYYRGDSAAVSFAGIGLHPGQWMSLAIAVAGFVVLWMVGRTRGESALDPEKDAEIAEQMHQDGRGQ